MSDLGSLSQCMLENDSESRGRARNLRRKALLISVVLEALLLGAMLLVAVDHAGVLARSLQRDAHIHPTAVEVATRKNQRRHTPIRRQHSSRPVPCLFCAKPAAPTSTHPYSTASASSGDSAPGIGDGGIDGPPGPGAWILGADPGGKPLEIKKPEPPEHKSPLHRSEGVMAAALIYKVQPQYSAIARTMRLTGTVYLRAIILTDGTVRQLEAISGNPILANLALQAVRQWRYQPTRLNGEPVEVETFITVNFILDQQ